MEPPLRARAAAIRSFVLAPYRSLRPPPESALAMQVSYLVLAIAMGNYFLIGYPDPDLPDALLAYGMGVFGVAGGLAGALSQFAGLWFLERGAIFALWGAIVSRIITITRLEVDNGPAETTARVLLVMAVGLLLIPRFMDIRGADQDPKR